MDSVQIIINIGILAIGALFGWLLKIFWAAVVDLREGLDNLREEHSRLSSLIPEKYMAKTDFLVFRHEMREDMLQIMKKLDKIDDKLDRKEDKE